MQSGVYKRAIPFIIRNQSTLTYQLTNEAKAFLQSIDNEVSVVSVAGLYRTGKSYLLNKVIIDKNGVFGVGPTVNPCTKGLWLWAEPDPTCQNRTMLVVDTEGLGALDEESNHDMKVFCLAVLLSTTFIYNSVGNIDQNALQTLSLVLNLVSTIDQDNSSFKPEFIWVVRDFSLQLIDEHGKTITSKEYLELALTSNMKEEQKSVIRKTITNAFSKRDCFTLVKPLIDEAKLQNLDNIPLDDLRPEFVKESIELRNKIKSTLTEFRLSNNGKLTGRDYATVVEKYVNAINEGAVPNMVDTWTFIKEEKCREALEEVQRVYTEKVKSKIINKIPTRRALIEDQLRALRDEVRAHYLKLTYDGSSTDPVDELFQNIYKQLMRLNEEETRVFIKSMLNKEYQPFAKKLFSHYYSTYEQFEKDLLSGMHNSATQKFSDKVDGFSDSLEKFVQQKLVDNFRFFEKKMKNEIEKLSHMKVEMEVAYEKQIQDLNEVKEQDRNAQKNRIFELEKKIRGLQSEREQLLENGKSEKTLVEGTCQILKKKNEEYHETIQELNKEINTLQSCTNELKERIFIEKKEYQKEKALFLQKEQYMGKKIREVEVKSSEAERKLEEMREKFQHDQRLMTSDFQQKIRFLESENKKITEQKLDADFKLCRAIDEAKQLNEEISIMKKRNFSDKKELESKIIEAESNKKPSRAQHELKQENQELLTELQKANEKCVNLSRKMKEINEELKNSQNTFEKEIAVHIQQIQFQQMEIKDLKERYEELKKSYQNALENFQDNSKTNEQSIQMKMYELTAQHQREMKNMESEMEEKAKGLKKEIQMLQRHKEEVSLQQSLEKKQAENKEKEWKEANNMLQSMVKKLQDKLQSSEKDYEDISKEKEQFYSYRIKQLEQEIDEVKERSSQEVSESAKKSEEALGVLKQYAEIEKQQWEKRLVDDREKNEKKLKGIREEYEKKMLQERSSLEEEVSQLQERLAHMDRIYNEKLQNLQYDHDISLQKLTNQLNQEKSKSMKEVALIKQNLEFTKQSYEKEITSKTKEFQQLLENTKKSLKAQYLENVRKVGEEKSILEEKYENLKKNSRQVEQNYLIVQNDLDKEKAISKEKEKNYERKIEEIEERLQTELCSYNKVIENINQKNSNERERLNREIEKKNRAIVELQEEKNQQETDFDNEKLNYENKINYYKNAKQKSKEDYDDMMKKFETTVKTISRDRDKYKDKACKEDTHLTEKYQEELEKLKASHDQKIKDCEDRISRLVIENRSLKDRISNYEMEKSELYKRPKDDKGIEKVEAIYEKRIKEYQDLIKEERENSRMLKMENKRLKQEAQQDISVYSAYSNNYQERPSISEISNSRLYNQNTTELKRKFTNTPLISKKSRVVDVEDFSEIGKHHDHRDRTPVERRY